MKPSQSACLSFRQDGDEFNAERLRDTEYWRDVDDEDNVHDKDTRGSSMMALDHFNLIKIGRYGTLNRGLDICIYVWICVNP